LTNKVADIFLTLSLCLLALVGGAYVWRTYVQPPTVTTRVTIVERPIILPPKVVILPGKQVLIPDTTRQVREDSLIKALNESNQLDSLARWRGQSFSASFTDTLSIVDSVGSFYLREIHKIKVDGATQMIEKMVTYLDGKLSSKLIETIVTNSRFDFSIGGLILLIGVIVGLLL